MTFKQIKAHYGSVALAAAKLRIKSRQTIYNWRKEGVPAGWQARIQLDTRGKLRAARLRKAA